MNIESLRYFQYVAKYQNITIAAKQLFTSQSTLSRQLMSLENELGVTLFHRNNKQMTLTRAGLTLSKEIDNFIHHYDTMIENVKLSDTTGCDAIRITLPDHLNTFIAKAVAKTNRLDTQILVENYTFNEISSAVRFHLYDIGITYDFSLANPDEFEVWPIGTDTFSLLYPKDYQLASREDTIKQLVQSLPLLTSSTIEPPFLSKTKHFLQDVSQTSLKIFALNNTESIISNVELGLGYGIIPSQLANLRAGNEKVGLSTMELADIAPTCKIVALYHADNLKPYLSSFLMALQQ